MGREYKRAQKLIKALLEALRTGSIAQVKIKRVELNQHLDSKHMGCITRAKLRAVACEKIKVKAAGYSQRGNNSTVQSLVN